MSRILVLSYTDMARDPRVDRQISFLSEQHEVVAAGYGPPVGPGVEFIDLRLPDSACALGAVARRARSMIWLTLRRHRGLYWRYPVNRHAYGRLSSIGAVDLVVANDLPTLPLALRIAGDVPVIYDAHEIYTEEHAQVLWWRLLVGPYLSEIERLSVPRVAGMMTVAPGIADFYADRYGVAPVVVTNAPRAATLEPRPVSDPVRIIHHGGAQPERRLELMIEAVGRLDGRFELDLMLVPSHPGYLDRLRRLAAARRNVRFVDPVGQREVALRCNDYDIGVYLLPPVSINQRYALPNKLFEFIQARLALVIGPSPEMARIVEDYACGVVTDDFTADSLVEALEALTPERIAGYKLNADRAARELNAERNRELVLGLVDRVLAAGPGQMELDRA